jgi:hypothetical protein
VAVRQFGGELTTSPAKLGPLVQVRSISRISILAIIGTGMLAPSRRHHIYMRPPRFDAAQLSLVRTPFDDPDFLFELKHDGFRALAHIWDGKCELVSRKRSLYKSFQGLRDKSD